MPRAVVADAENVYWITEGTIETVDAGLTVTGTIAKAPWGGGTQTTLTTGILTTSSVSIAVDGASVCWTDGSSIMKVSKDGGSPTVVVTMNPPSWAAP